MISFLKKFLIGEWNLGISNMDFIKAFSKIKKGGNLRLPIKWVSHKRFGSFFADPFIYKIDSENALILAEEYIFSRRKGIISLCTIDRKTAKMISRKVVLEETCHLSYPFYDDSSQRFAPESSRNNHWASYKFDGSIVSEKMIISQEPLIDTTPIEWNGRWYLFTVKQPDALDQLLIYSSDRRYGEYTAHPQNPVKIDIRTSRPGGKCFVIGHELYRIVQDSTHRYGERLHIMHVKELSPTAFSEEKWCDIEIESDGKYPLGIHTLNFNDNFIVVDGFREVYRPLFAAYIYKVVPLLRKFGLHK